MTNDEREQLQQDRLRETEPDHYVLIQHQKLLKHRIGGRDYNIAFCVNSPGAAGCHSLDPDLIWLADEIVDPVRAIEILIHESLHAIFPGSPESKIHEAGLQISTLIKRVFDIKATGPLPTFMELATPTMLQKAGDQLAAAIREDRATGEDG